MYIIIFCRRRIRPARPSLLVRHYYHNHMCLVIGCKTMVIDWWLVRVVFNIYVCSFGNIIVFSLYQTQFTPNSVYMFHPCPSSLLSLLSAWVALAVYWAARGWTAATADIYILLVYWRRCAGLSRTAVCGGGLLYMWYIYIYVYISIYL